MISMAPYSSAHHAKFGMRLSPAVPKLSLNPHVVYTTTYDAKFNDVVAAMPRPLAILAIMNTLCCSASKNNSNACMIHVAVL